MEHFPPLFLLISLLFFSSSSAFGVFKISDYSENAIEEGSKVASTITVDKSGHGTFNTIQAAIDSIPSQNTQWVIVQIYPAIYM